MASGTERRDEPGAGEVDLVRNRYQVLRVLGHGGEAQVVQALDHQHDRLVVLKIRTVTPGAPAEAMLREPAILLELPPHPALPVVREDFFEGHKHYTVMDWVDGTDLQAVLEAGGTPGLAPSSVLAYVAQAAAALTSLHQHDPPVIHGDVKPANLILARGGQIVLVDFGLSSTPANPEPLMGSAGYQAPELAAGGPMTRASDIYALAATAFALITGAPPAGGALPAWHGLEPARAQRLKDALRAGLATDPAARPDTPGEFVERLRAGWASTLPTGVVTFVCAEVEIDSLPWDTDPSAAAATLVRCDDVIAAAVEARDGRFLKEIGEPGLTHAAFDSAGQALAAAVEAATALLRDDRAGAVRARFGLNTGEALVQGGGYVGPAVTLANRVCAAAAVGEVLLTAGTARLVGDAPDGYLLVDVGPLELDGSDPSESLTAVVGPGLSTPAGGESPYRGLLALGPDDAALYFGREEVLASALERIGPGRFLAVVGASGSGKSSLLGAGVAAAVSRGEVPGVRWARMIAPGAEPSPQQVDGSDDELLIVDQFEELFTQCRDPAIRAEFIERLLARAGATVIGLRADFYSEVGAEPALADRVAANQLLLGPMREEDLLRAVCEPALAAGLRLEPGLVDRILRDVAGEPAALPLMSHALRETWELRRGRTLTLAAYEASGGVGTAVARSADTVLMATPERDRPLLRGMFVRMTELGDDVEDTRRRVPIAELVAQDEHGETARALLERLAAARLVTLDADSAEVAHEVLIRRWPTLRSWLDEDRDGIRLHRRLGEAARLWEAGGCLAADLYRGGRLDAVLEWAAVNHEQLNAVERTFLNASVEESQRMKRREAASNRRLRRALAGAAGLVVVAAALLVFALMSRGNAVHAESIERSQKLAADSEQQVSLDPQLALLLARAALQAASTAAAELAASEALDANTERAQLPSIGVQSCSYGDQLYVLDAGRTAVDDSCAGTLVFANLRTRKIVRQVKLATPANYLLPPTGGGRTLLVSSGDREIAYDLSTGRARTLFTAPFPIAIAAVSPDRNLYAVTDGVTVAIVNTRTRRTRVVPSAAGVASLQWISNRELLVTGRNGTGGSLLPAALVVLDLAGRKLRQLRLPLLEPARWTYEILSVALSPDRRTAFVAAATPGAPADSTGAIWAVDIKTGKVDWVDDSPPGAIPGRVVPSPDGRLLAVGNSLGVAQVLDARTGALVATDHVNSNLVRGWLAFPNDSSLLTMTLDGVLRIWGNRAGERFQIPVTGGENNGELGFVAGTDNPVVIGVVGQEFDGNDGKLLRTFPGYVQGGSLGYCLFGCSSVSPGFAWLTYAVPDRSSVQIAELDAQTGARVPPVSVSQADAQAVAPDGKIAVAYVDGSTLRVKIVNPRTGFVRELQPAPGAPGCAAQQPSFSANGQLVAVADDCVRATIWDVGTGRIRRSIVLPDTADYEAGGKLTPDGRYLLTPLETGALVRVNIASGAVAERPGTRVRAIAISPDGRFYAVGREDGTVDEYDARTLDVVRHLVLPDQIWDLAYSPDGRMLEVEDQDGLLQLWDTCDICENPGALARRAAAETVRSLTPSEEATFGVRSP